MPVKDAETIALEELEERLEKLTTRIERIVETLVEEAAAREEPEGRR